MRFMALLAAGALLCAAPVAPAAAKEQMTQAEADAVQLALDRGVLLYEFDQAAWHATDAMMAAAKANGSEDRLKSIGGGYVIEGNVEKQLVTFFDRGDVPRALFRATRTRGSTQVALTNLMDAPEALTPEQLRLARERRALFAEITAKKVLFCAEAIPNVAILPATGASRAEVAYAMTPQTALQVWPMGGHYRYTFRDGQPSDPRPFTKSCISLTTDANGKGKPAALTITHLLDPTPTEIHVFTMLAANLPIYVMTQQNQKIWVVEYRDGQATIRLLDREQLAQPAANPGKAQSPVSGATR